jgi:predicted phage baseplate assembly protein
MALRSGPRAVTADDFERHALAASAQVARAKCLPPTEPGRPIRVLLIPRLHVPPSELRLDDLALPAQLVDEVGSYLDERRLLTSTAEITTPFYQGVTVLASVQGGIAMDPGLLKDRLLEVLYTYINPLVGGPQGSGWPFGREINVGEVFSLLSGVDGVVGVETVEIRSADLLTGKKQEPSQRVVPGPEAVLASYQHQVLFK